MNLAEPTLGDIIDRLSILAIRYGAFNDDQVSEMRDLNTWLEERLATQYNGGNDARRLAYLVRAAAALGAVNGRLWEFHEHRVLEDMDGAFAYAKKLNGYRRDLAGSLK